MAKNKRHVPAPKPASEDRPATLKDLISPDALAKLKAQAESMKAEEAKKQEEAQRKAAEARKAEQKRLDNDFGHLLENSKLDWKQYK